MSIFEDHIRTVPDFPKPGIMFKDITTLLGNASALHEALDALAAPFSDERIDVVVGVEARGFILGGAVADRLGAGFVPARKRGKLPAECVEETYDLEYGTDTIAMHRDSIHSGQRVLMLDDLLATGGTMSACCRLVEKLGGRIVACVFLVELSYLGGRQGLADYRVVSLVDYEQE